MILVRRYSEGAGGSSDAFTVIVYAERERARECKRTRERDPVLGKPARLCLSFQTINAPVPWCSVAGNPSTRKRTRANPRNRRMR